MKTIFSSWVECLEKKALSHPDKPAFIFLENGGDLEIPLTFGELQRKAKAIAGLLQESSSPGQRAILLFPPGLDFITALFGCFYAGIVAAPLFPPDPNRLPQTLPPFLLAAKDCHAETVLTNQMIYSFSEFLTQMSPELKKMNWLAVDSLDMGSPPNWKVPAIGPQNLALLMYTSGSTGNPKGVMLTHRNLFHSLMAIMDRYPGDHSKECGVGWAPPYHITGLIFGILTPIYLGGTNIFMSPLDFLAKPVRWLKAQSKYKALLSGGPNFAYDLCARHISSEEKKELDLSHWKVALVGAEPTRAETLRNFSKAFASCGFHPEVFLSVYGLTEAGLGVSATSTEVSPKIVFLQREPLKSGIIAETNSNDPDSLSLVSCGSAVKDVRICVVDPVSLVPCAPHRVGEIWVASPGVGQGYWNREEENQRTFRAHLATTGEGPFLRTGDLGFVKDGELYLTGRLKEMIIIRGVNYYPMDIETVVASSHPHLQNKGGAAFAIEEGGQERIVLVFESEKLKKSEYEEIFRSSREAVSLHFKIQVFAVVLVKEGSIPRTGTRKVQRKASKDAFVNGSLEVLAKWQMRGSDEDKLASDQASLMPPPKKEEEIQSWLISKIESLLGISNGELNLDQSLPAYGLDSLRAVELSSKIERDVGVPFGVTKLFESPSIRDLIQEVRQLWKTLKEKGSLGKPRGDLEQEIQLDSSISFAHELGPNNQTPKNILLTGATGYLGAFFLKELLESTGAKIFCLVRASDEISALRRIKKNLESFNLWDEAWRSRIHPLVGDLSKPLLGLSEDHFQELAATIDVIYHNGANVNFIYSYWDLKPANVGGTQEVIRLGAAKKLKPLHYISTVSVFPIAGQAKGKALSEEPVPNVNDKFLNGYAKTKWVSEQLLGQAEKKGLPINIYRVGEVVGHSRSGMAKTENDVLSLLIKGATLLKIVPEMNGVLYLVPVDFVVHSIFYLSRQKNSSGKIFHIIGEATTGTELLDYIKSLGYPLQIKPFKKWLEDLENFTKGVPFNPVAPLMPFLKSSGVEQLAESKSQLVLDNQRTLESLKESGMVCPPAKMVLDDYFGYLERSGFLKRNITSYLPPKWKLVLGGIYLKTRRVLKNWKNRKKGKKQA